MVKLTNSRKRLRKVQLSCYVERGHRDALKSLSQRTGVPQQVYMRKGLDMVLRQNGALGSDSRTISAVEQYARFQTELQAVLRRTQETLTKLRAKRS
jgi:hypothetical protein